MEKQQTDVWIFGYGSLIWKTNFAYTESQVGHIKSFVRRFWQGSSDHRGTHEKPGRVATILPTGNHDDQVWGRAYKLKENEIETTFRYLNHREKNGYELQSVLFHPKNGQEAFRVPIYISSEDNPHFLGEAPLEEMAQHIFSSIGPSGANLDYFLHLLTFMNSEITGYHDEHMLKLEVPIKRLMREKQHEISSSCESSSLDRSCGDDMLVILKSGMLNASNSTQR